MEGNDTKKMVKIILIGAVVLCGVGMILPWSGFSMNMMGVNMGIEFYPWGSHIYADYGAMGSMFEGTGMPTSMNMWSILYVVTTGVPETGTSGLSTTTDITSGNVAVIGLMILSFIFCIVALIGGILAFIKMKHNKNKMSLFAGIASLVAIIFFAIAVNILLSSDPTGTTSMMLNWSSGFYVMIISMILFFISFGLLKTAKGTPAPVEKTVTPQ